jgi:hypothetical protein
MSEHLERCSWKLVDPGKFTMGISADRCGAIADVVVLRPNRKTDLFLCELHMNEFIKHWGLHNEVRILCQEEPQIDWDDIPPVPLVADPSLVTYRISSGTKIPKAGRTCTCRNGCKAWDCDGGR